MQLTLITHFSYSPQEHRTPLHYAAMRGKRRIVEVMLLFGADVSLLTKVKDNDL